MNTNQITWLLTYSQITNHKCLHIHKSQITNLCLLALLLGKPTSCSFWSCWCSAKIRRLNLVSPQAVGWSWRGGLSLWPGIVLSSFACSLANFTAALAAAASIAFASWSSLAFVLAHNAFVGTGTAAPWRKWEQRQKWEKRTKQWNQWDNRLLGMEIERNRLRCNSVGYNIHYSLYHPRYV